MSSDLLQLDSCIEVVDGPIPDDDHDHGDAEQQQSEAIDSEAKADAVVISSGATTDESVSGSSFTNSTSASINSRTTLGVNSNNNKDNGAAASSSSASVRPHQRRVLAFQLNGTVVHRRSNATTKNPIQMLSNLFSSMMGGDRGARKYGMKRQILQRTRSSLRKPQLVSVRSRGSIHNQKRDMVDMDGDDTNNGGTHRENAFDMLLRFCDTPADIAFLRNHPDHLERLGIPVEQYSTIFDELNFFLIKREQLREAEQKVRQRKQNAKKKINENIVLKNN